MLPCSQRCQTHKTKKVVLTNSVTVPSLVGYLHVCICGYCMYHGCKEFQNTRAEGLATSYSAPQTGFDFVICKTARHDLLPPGLAKGMWWWRGAELPFHWELVMKSLGVSPTFQCMRHKRGKRWGFSPWVGKSPWRRPWQPTPVFFPGESHGQRSLVGCSPRGHKESNTTKAA